MSKVLLGVPVEVAEHKVKAVTATRAASPAGLRLGLLDNTKGNADQLLGMLAEGMKRGVRVAALVARRKASVSAPAHVDILDQLAAQSDFVITAIAD